MKLLVRLLLGTAFLAMQDVAAGERTSYVLLDKGSVMAFGAGMDGQLGCGPLVWLARKPACWFRLS
jgi:hypothetical protein